MIRNLFFPGILLPLLAFAQPGRNWPDERTRYADPVTGVEIVELTSGASQPSNLYFHFSNFTADNRHILFSDNRSGSSQLFRLEVSSGRITQLTRGDNVHASAATTHPDQPNIAYYIRGHEVLELDILSLKERRIGEIPAPRVGGYVQPTLSHDRKSLALAKQRDEANWEIGLMDLTTGSWRTVITQGFRITHVQHHPKLPLIFYVWETGGYAPQRTWIVNSDGSANRPFYATTDPKLWLTPLKEWITHESWISETGEMTMILDKNAILIAGPDGKIRQTIPGDYWHVAARHDGRFLVADDNKGNLWLIETSTANSRLLATGLRNTVRAVHVHASFDRKGRYIFFNSGRMRQTIALIDLDRLPSVRSR